MTNVRLRSVWSTDQVPGYSRLYTESLLKRKRREEKEKGEGKREGGEKEEEEVEEEEGE